MLPAQRAGGRAGDKPIGAGLEDIPLTLVGAAYRAGLPDAHFYIRGMNRHMRRRHDRRQTGEEENGGRGTPRASEVSLCRLMLF